MTALYFTRAELRRDVPAAALRSLLVPDGEAIRAVTSHHLVWTLFADAPDRERDFLWREHAPGIFYMLSSRPPLDEHRLFVMQPPKPFEPAFRVGDSLSFELRVNATVSRGGAPGVRGKKCDIVMDALHSATVDDRATTRRTSVDGVARSWLVGRGRDAGFEVTQLSVQGYSVLQMPRSRGRATAKLGVLDLTGRVVVRDGVALLAAIQRGVGRGKAFGCGLMLVRRA
jgi:CRISPR system Cascade subunit CasE